MESESIIPNSSRCVVKNICISDVATGIIVFQKVYKWKESSAFYNLGNLIQALYQFAQTTDDGQINCVNFESGRMLTTRMRNHDSAQNCNQTMQMMTAKSDEVIVSIFYETNGLDVLPWEDRDKLQVLLYTLLAAFEENYLSDLVMRRPSLPRELEEQSIVSGDSDAHTITAFSEFGQVVDLLRHELFPDHDLSSTQITAEEPTLDPNMTLDEHVRKMLGVLNKSGLLEAQRRRRVPPKADPISVDSASYPDSSSANEPPSPPPRPKVLQRHLESPSSDTYSAELNDNRNDEGAASSATYRRIHDDRRDGVGEDYDEESIEKEREFRRGGGGDDQQTDSSTSTQGNNRMTGGMFGKYFSSDTPDSRESTTAERHDGSNRSNTISELSENTLEWRSKHDSSRVTDGITSLKD